MAVTTTYDSSIARVRVSADDLGSDCDWALVERSTDGIRWTTVRGGSEWPVTAGEFNATLDDFEFPSGEATTYRVKSYDDTNFDAGATHLSGVVLDGASTCNVTSPDAASFDIVGDLELQAEFTPRDWSPALNMAFCSKWSGAGQRSWCFRINPDRTMSLFWTTDGTTQLSKVSTAAVPIPTSGRTAVKVTLDVNNGAAGHDIKFYTAASLDGTWVQLGSTVTTAGVTSIFSSTSPIELGTNDTGVNNRYAGILHRCKILSGIGGTVVGNPDFEAQAAAAASFADTATPAKTWTMNTGAEIVVTQSDDITAELDGIWLKSIIRPYLNREVRVVGFDQVTRPANAGMFDVIGRSFPVAVTDVRGSRRYNLTVRTETREDAEDFDIILASGDPIFLHSSTVDHMWLPSQLYAVIGDTTQTRLGTREATTCDFLLPLTEVAAPSADIAGVAVSWQAIINAYGTWQDVNDTFADWQAVLDSVGAGSDVIVP